MKFNFTYTYIFVFLFSCTQDMKIMKKPSKIVQPTYSSKGFALIYDKSAFESKIVDQKLNNSQKIQSNRLKTTLENIPSSVLMIDKHGEIVVANHAFGVVDGVAICSLISSVRQDYKIITHKVLRQAEAAKEKIIPIDFSKSRNAILSNINARKQAEKILLNNGVVILFPSGQIATKENFKKKTKAHDGEWKQFTSKLVIKTKSPVLPIYFEGQNSQLFHFANKMGLTFRYSLMMYELKRKIGDTINLHVGEIIPFSQLNEIGDLIKITKYLRQKTYALDPNFK